MTQHNHHHQDHQAHGEQPPHPRTGAEGDVHAGHDKHAGHSVASFRDKFWFTLLLTIPTLIWSGMIQHWFDYTAPQFPGSAYIPAVFGTIVYFYGGSPFLRGGYHELRNRLPGMMTLISLAITVAFLYSALVTLGVVEGLDLWWELATLVAIMLLGHWIEMRSINQAQGALKELAKLLPDMAVRLDEAGTAKEVSVAELKRGDLLLIRPGASIPADGVVKEGTSAVNEAMITGESKPMDKSTGDRVIAGTVNGQGSLRVEVTGTGDETALAGIMRLVEQAQTSRSRAQALADRAAFYLTIIAIVSAAVTAIVWPLLGRPWSFTIERVVTVLVIACPHALGLAIPLVTAISTTIGARNGLLVRDRRGLEEARLLNTVVFDKTGTLTLGSHRVVKTTAADGLTDDEVLRVAASVQRDAEHPIAQALMTSAKEHGIDVPMSQDFESMPGRGVRAVVEERSLHVGGPGLLRMLAVEPPETLRRAAEAAAADGQSATYLVEGDKVLAVFAIADAIRPESFDAVKRLHASGLEVVLLTGDSTAVANAVAKELDIDTVFAEVLPEDKVAKIEELQAQGKRVAMVGDGVNDAPALLTSDVGIAIGTGTDVAVEAGDVVLVRSDPRDVPAIIALSKATYRKMIQNLWWAAGYNIVAIPLAAGVLASWGILLQPALGAVLMSLSTIVVAINAQLLRRAVRSP
ncbi:heavy metal translocating P-type ATPase [Novilysobacter spongiicola]|uniref:Cu2+-exporting ATPase n=1 Tax=Lysobacter spongiicola DSM 21749 TaxID=1122188 RepID=A0A1T4M168_9GAMM|nr:heavy metal translocating P-type ATPase [Lysobacter spongiicola]SJZ60627.1 Cu2+-exporting ATPase [Lysobacter spongiicola DSM 21749]